MSVTKEIPELLNDLLKRRNGGAINIRGIQYQTLYACSVILDKLSSRESSNHVRLEGIEDLDLISNKIICSDNLYIQLKTSVNKMDAGNFWNLGILQNFLNVYLLDPSSKFRLVYNMKISDGQLKNLIQHNLDNRNLYFWKQKLSRHTSSEFDILSFFNSISYEHQSEQELSILCTKLLFEKWDITKGTEMQYFKSLFYHVLDWSKNRNTITHIDVIKLFAEIKDQHSKAAVNPAVANNYIHEVDFYSTAENSFDYFEGKAAQPYHVAACLPARRKKWEETISESMSNSNVTIIRSSSGQGKSTLAWQIGLELSKNNTIYQVNVCRNWEEANAIADFLETRLYIGQDPIVIIDGLNSTTEKWGLVVEKVGQKGIKFLVTARQEDWFRYGGDISRIKVNLVDISLSLDEAKSIFEQFEKTQKLHQDITAWQPAYELVRENGLLIEYTFLLTRGEMIRERLENQLKTINQTASGISKFEILRLVSMANCINLQVSSKALLKHIADTVGFSGDRGETLAELENEYFLSFNRTYIEGLHPVRSSHLTELLHRTIPESETLLNLYKILQPDQKPDFFANAVLIIKPEEKYDFYKCIAGELKNSTAIEMVQALDAISHAEPLRYWFDNRDIFDQVFKNGGLDLFVMQTIPKINLTTLQELKVILGAQSSKIDFLLEKLQDLPRYSLKESDISFFALELFNGMKDSRKKITSFDGLSSLTKWYNRLGFKLDFLFTFDEELLKLNDNTAFSDMLEIYQYFQMTNPVEFKNYIEKNRENILSYIKVKTGSVSVEEGDEDNLIISFIVKPENTLKPHQQSVTRIESAYSLLPYYSRYDTDGLILPFPSQQAVMVVQTDASKRLKPKVLIDQEAVRYNQIWSQTIIANYHSTSAYEWQDQIFTLRSLALEWARKINSYIEALIEGDLIQQQVIPGALQIISENVSERIHFKKSYPKFGRNMLRRENKPIDEKAVNDWITSLNNANNQLMSFFIPKEPAARNLAFIQLKSIIYKLQEMQRAYAKIEALTVAYFNTTSLIANEDKVYTHLLKTVNYFYSHDPINRFYKKGKDHVDQWYCQEQKSKLKTLENILLAGQFILDHQILPPQRLEETEHHVHTTLAIVNFDFKRMDAMELICRALYPLADFPSTFFTLLNVQGKKAIGGLRFSKRFFEIIRDGYNGSEMEELDNYLPLPIVPADNITDILPEIEALNTASLNIEITVKAEIINKLWEFSKYKAKINLENGIEKAWFEKLTFDTIGLVEEQLKKLNLNPTNDFFIWVKTNLTEKPENNDSVYVELLSTLLQ
jgi:hypothetical protein